MLKPKLLFLCKYYPPEPGGIELTSEKLVDFSDKNFSVSTISFKRRKSSASSTKNYKFFSAFELFRQPVSIRYFLNSIFFGLNTDILYIHYPNIISAIVGIMVKVLKPKKKLIVHYHADTIFSSLILGFIFRFVTKHVLMFSDGIIVTSANYAEGSVYLKDFKHKTKIIPLSTSQTTKNTCDVPNENKNILFVGRLVPYKGIVEFARYIDEIDPAATINLVGDGPLRTQLIDTIGNLKTKNRVNLLGYVNNNDLNNLVSGANLLILPSVTKAEAFGLTMLEAQACGVPSVCFDIPGSGVTFANKHNVTGYNVVLYDYSKFNFYINKILSERPFSKEALVDHHAKNFSDSIVRNQWLKYLKKIS